MDTYSILNRPDKTTIIIPRKIKAAAEKDQIIYFYAPTSKLHPKMSLLYFYSSSNNKDEADFVSWKSSENGFNLIGSCYVFPDSNLNFNLAILTVRQHTSGAGLTFEWGTDGLIHFWVFPDKDHIKLYQLAALVWSPAQNYADEIVEILEKNYQVVDNYDILVAKPKLLGFVRKIYQGDKRCDKSQLPWKCQQMLPYYPKIRYIKFLVKELDLDYMRVSQTAVMIKDIIRRQFKKRIPNYVHDIIFHISDNQSHSRSMETVIKKMKRI